jgi:hypothetical protein
MYITVSIQLLMSLLHVPRLLFFFLIIASLPYCYFLDLFQLFHCPLFNIPAPVVQYFFSFFWLWLLNFSDTWNRVES